MLGRHYVDGVLGFIDPAAGDYRGRNPLRNDVTCLEDFRTKFLKADVAVSFGSLSLFPNGSGKRGK